MLQVQAQLGPWPLRIRTRQAGRWAVSGAGALRGLSLAGYFPHLYNLAGSGEYLRSRKEGHTRKAVEEPGSQKVVKGGNPSCPACLVQQQLV